MSKNPYYTAEKHGDFALLELGDFMLDSGVALNNAVLAYKTFGKLNEAGDNAILFPVMFSGTHAAMAPYVGAGLALDPEKYFIIIPNQLGGGLSTSPHNSGEGQAGGAFPVLSIGDDVRAQHKLLTEHLGVKQLQLVTGWSMGAQQTYEWLVRYPNMVVRGAPIAGTAKTTPHCALYVDVFCATLSSDPAWADGAYLSSEDVHQGLKRMAHVFAMMGVCPELYNTEAWAGFGFHSMENFLADFWEAWFSPMDPNNLLCMAKKWRAGDVSEHTDGDLKAALGSIQAKVHVIAFERDMFILPEDCKHEQQMIPQSEFVSIPSLWGHFAMLGVAKEDFEAVDRALAELLSAPT